MGKKIICNSCGAEFHELEPKCPYCGTMNYKGAELEYFEKLEDVREDLEELTAVPLQETKKEIKKQGKFVKKVIIIGIILLIIIFGWPFLMDKLFYERDQKADFIWKSENFAVMDEMYEKGQYEELVDFFYEAIENDKPVYDWEHYAFIELYDSVSGYQSELSYMEQKKAQGEEVTVDDYKWLLWSEFSVIAGYYEEGLTEEDKAYFAEEVKEVEERLKNDWDFDAETYESYYSQVAKPYGHISVDECEKYVKEWLKKGDK